MDTSWKILAKWHNSVFDQLIVHPFNGKNCSATASSKINHFESSKVTYRFWDSWYTAETQIKSIAVWNANF